MMAWLVSAATAPVLALASVAADVPARAGEADGARQPLHAAHRPPVRSSTPPTSPGRALFNDPLGTERAQYGLIRHVDTKIDGAGPTSVVRLAAYSFAMPSTAQALLRAHRRGAAVKVVVDGHSARWGSVRNLRRQLGGNRHRRSFVVVCRHSCRGVAGNQHAKFVTISHTGRRDDVVLVGSMNFTAFAASRQWQDLYSVAGNHRLYRQFVRVFKQMTRDHPQRIHLLPPGDGFGTEVAPIVGRPVVDPVARRLGLVHCRGATGGTGLRGRTVLRVSMHAWNGDRGVRLARQVAGLARAGCNVKVVLGVGAGRQVASVLRHARVSFRRSRDDRPATHQKLMLVSGHFGRARNADYAWTGSHNWTDRSLRNDEMTLRVSGARQVTAYRVDFGRIWRSLSG